MSDFIRGGQVTLHKFRMFMQVTKVLTRLSIVLLLISMMHSYYKNISLHEWRVGAAWVKKDFVSSFNPDTLITYESQWGLEKTIPAKELEYDLHVLDIVDKFEFTLYKGLISAGMMIGVFIGGIGIFFWVRGRYLKRMVKLRGVFLISKRNLRRKIKKHNSQFDGYASYETRYSRKHNKYTPYKIADFEFPITGEKSSWTSGEQSHVVVIGASGSGKTIQIMDLVKQIREKNGKAIIIDVKGDFIKYFYNHAKGDVILNPLDKRGRNWNMFKETDPLKGFANIAKSFMPKNSKDPIWADAARGVMEEMALLYMNENLSLSEFANKMLKTDMATLEKLLKKTSVSKIINEDIEKAALSVLMVLSTYLRPFKLYRSNADSFVITDWVKDDKQQGFLFISSNAEVKKMINPLVAAQVDIAINALCALREESDKPKIWFFLDELPYFEDPIANLKQGLATARSKGGCFILGAQEIAPLDKIYSRADAQSIINNCSTKIFLKASDKETMEWCSTTLGEGEIEEWHEGISYGAHEMRDGITVNRSRSFRKAVLPSEFKLLKTAEGFISFSSFEPAKFKFRKCKFNVIAEAYIANADLMQLLEKEVAEGEKRRKEIEEKLTRVKSLPSNNYELNLEEKPNELLKLFQTESVEQDTDEDAEQDTEEATENKVAKNIQKEFMGMGF